MFIKTPELNTSAVAPSIIHVHFKCQTDMGREIENHLPAEVRIELTLKPFPNEDEINSETDMLAIK